MSKLTKKELEIFNKAWDFLSEVQDNEGSWSEMFKGIPNCDWVCVEMHPTEGMIEILDINLNFYGGIGNNKATLKRVIEHLKTGALHLPY